MEINTNPNSIVPLYAQIVESLKRDIENGVYNATERIPAEAELAKQYNVSRITGALTAGCGGASKDTMSAASVTEEAGAYEYEAWGTDA